MKITVKTFHGNYLGATPEGKVVGNRERPIDYEIWTLKKYEGHYFSLCSFYNQYLSVDQNSQVTTSPNVGPNEVHFPLPLNPSLLFSLHFNK